MPNVRRKPASSRLLFRQWLIPALLFSALLHFFLLQYSRSFTFQPFSARSYEKFIPRAFQMKQVEIDPRLLATEERQPATTKPARKEIPIPEPTEPMEPPAEIIGTPAAPPLKEPLLQSPQAVRGGKLDPQIQSLEPPPKGSFEREMASVPEALLETQPVRAARPILDVARKGTDAGSSPLPTEHAGKNGEGETPSGFSNLDDLLAQSGPLTGSRGPILMPTDLLFDYDSDTLRDIAVASLAKLGTLIQRNPNARFRIEGHTDGFGSDEYNLRLSENRAVSVKQWLVSKLGIDPGRIETLGLGKTRLLVPPDKTVEEQQLNRRVEIVIKTR